MGFTITVDGSSGYTNVKYNGIIQSAGSFEVGYGDKVQIEMSTSGSGDPYVYLNYYQTSSADRGYLVSGSSYEYIPNNDATITRRTISATGAGTNERYYYGAANIVESDAWGEPPSAGESKQTMLIGGTTYHAKSGKTLIDGTAYAMKQGKTLIDGAVYTQKFGGSGGYKLTLAQCYNGTGSLLVTVTDKDGNKKHEYGRDCTGKSYSEIPLWADLLETDSIKVELNQGSNSKAIWLNGSSVASGDSKSNPIRYTMASVTGDVIIAQEQSNSFYYAKITMPT